MREIHVDKIVDAVEKLCIDACYYLGDDVTKLMKKAREDEVSDFGQSIMDQLLDNIKISRDNNVPMCQDTGMTVVFLEIGQDAHIVGGNLQDAINEGVRRGYKNGYLRKSVLTPIERINTKDNTPAVIHTEIVPGEQLKITVAPKGAGSENMSRLKMLTPSQGLDGIKDFIMETVTLAGGCPCPPIILGVGIGGTMEKAAYMAKKSLIRKAGEHNADPSIAKLEEEMLEKINKTGIGPQGLGGRSTAMAVHIDAYPTHIAELPIAVNLQCHAARHKEAIL